MYRNLEAELTRKGITREMLAKAIGVSTSTISIKLSGKARLLLEEAYAIKRFLGVDISIEELFKTEKSTA